MLRTQLVRLSFALSLSLALAAPVLGADASYTVQRGDTLSAISRREHVSVGELVRLNHLSDADFLREGQVLRLAAAAQCVNDTCSARTAVRTNGARARHVAHEAAPDSPAEKAQARALWIATHAGSSGPDFYDGLSFAATQKALVVEVRLTRTAMRYLGVPYSWGGESFNGVDCSGFVQAVFRRNGVELPRTADAQFAVGRRVPEGRLEPGDLVFFETYTAGASHVGIYLGDGRFVHASYSNGVRVDSLMQNYYSNRFIGARRLAI